MRQLLLGFFSCLLSTVIFGQNFCGTVQSEGMTQQLIKNKTQWEEIKNNRNVVPRFVPITFHLVANSQGGGRISRDAIYNAVCLLNQRYEDSNAEIYFYVNGFQEINDDRLYSDIRDNEFLTTSKKDNFAMNIFVVDDISTQSTGTTLGYYSPGRDLIVMLKRSPGDDGYTLEHEIGHFLTLRHTHYGWEDEPFDRVDYGDKVTFTTISGSSQVPFGEIVPVELADGSNCEDAGDLLCDTPPDYGVGFTCSCCTMPYPIMDSNCDTIQTQMNNIMSYSSRCDSMSFSPEQVLAMQASLDSPSRAYLRVNNTTTDTYTPVLDRVITISPEPFETVENYSNVVFEWEPVENAEFYVLSVNNDNYETAETSYTITDLGPNMNFLRYSVKAYGKFGGGCGGVSEVNFRTGDNTSVTDLDFVEDIKIYPNPVAEYTDLTVSFESSKTMKADLLIYNVTGQVVISQEERISNSSNSFSVGTQGLNRGVYLLEVKTEEGSITEKIIIE